MCIISCYVVFCTVPVVQYKSSKYTPAQCATTMYPHKTTYYRPFTNKEYAILYQKQKTLLKEREMLIENFMCIAITKKIINKKFFTDKGSVYAYFQQKFEAEIHEEKKTSTITP